MQIILKTLWALSLVVFSATYVFGQEEYTFQQDNSGANNVYAVLFDMVDATDGDTSETGLTPTCNILYPGKTSYVSCPDSVTNIGSGTYRVRFSTGPERESLGYGSLYITSAGAKNKRLKYRMIEDSNRFSEGASYIKAPSDFNNTAVWSLNELTATSNSTNDYLGEQIADTLTGNGATSQHRAIFSTTSRGGSRLHYGTVEVQSGTLNNIWVGDDNHSMGMDFNTSTGVVSTTANGKLRGWKVELLKSSPSIWRLHWIYSIPPTDVTGVRLTIALGNGTVGTAPPSFATSGTMIVARAYLAPVEGVNPAIIETVLPHLAGASSPTSVTLDANENVNNSYLINREICFVLGYQSTVQVQDFKACSCIRAYNGTTKVATLNPATFATLTTNYKYKIGGLCSVPDRLADLEFTIASVSSTYLDLNSPANATIGDAYRGRQICLFGGTGDGQCRCINSYDPSTRRAYVDRPWNTVPVIGGKVMIGDYCSGIVTRMDSGTVTASAITADAITDVKMSTAARNAIADTTWRRSSTNIEGSSYGDTIGYKSGYGVIAQQTHKSNASLGVQSVYKADGTTVLNSRSYNSNPSAEPITGLD